MGTSCLCAAALVLAACPASDLAGASRPRDDADAGTSQAGGSPAGEEPTFDAAVDTSSEGDPRAPGAQSDDAGALDGSGPDPATPTVPPTLAESDSGPAPAPVAVRRSAARHAATHDAGVAHADRIVFFLGDGMGIPVVTAARIFAHGEDGELAMDRLPETAFVRTYSRDSRVTDSAPSMSAYMTGVKMNNDVIAMSAETPVGGEGRPVPTLLEQAKAAGWSTGIVTTTRVTHATPAATFAHVSHRDWEDAIAAQLVPGGEGFNALLGDGLDVVFGGGWKHFLPATKPGGSRSDKRDLLAELSLVAGYRRVESRDGLLALSPDASVGKVIGLFGASHLSYELVRPKDEPSLSELAVKAVQLLDRNPRGFFLMVEGGRIDHALHETTAKKALVDLIAFDDAIAAVLAELRRSDPRLERTLVVVTADHDHTHVHNGYARRTGRTTPSNAGVLGLVRRYDTAEATPAVDLDGRPYTILGFGNGERRLAGPRSLAVEHAESETSGDDFRQEAAIRMPVGAETHGGADVALKAEGRGAERFHGFLTNTEVYGLLCEAAAL